MLSPVSRSHRTLVCVSVYVQTYYILYSVLRIHSVRFMCDEDDERGEAESGQPRVSSSRFEYECILEMLPV